jgi:hypothetical protein
MTNPIRWAALSALVVCTTLLAAPPADEPGKAEEQKENPTAEYIEYRCLPELGQITISDGVVRGAKAVKRVETSAPELARRGIFACVDRNKPRVYRRTDELDGHRFETVVVINPPEDVEDDWTRHLTVRVDGRKKVDCSLGSSPEGDVFVYGVTIFPEDGTVEVAAADAEGGELLPPEELEKLDSRGVITDDTLQPPPDDDEPEKPKPEKV